MQLAPTIWQSLLALKTQFIKTSFIQDPQYFLWGKSAWLYFVYKGGPTEQVPSVNTFAKKHINLLEKERCFEKPSLCLHPNRVQIMSDFCH